MTADQSNIPPGWPIPYVARPEAARPAAMNAGDSESDRLIQLFRERYDLGRTTAAGAFAVRKHGPRVARPLENNSTALECDLVRAYYEKHGKIPSSTAIEGVLKLATGEAEDMPAQELNLRFARVDESEVLIDLGDATGQAIRVTPQGWELVEPPKSVLFRRTELTAPIPHPEHGGNLDELKTLLNVSDTSWPLLVGWCVAAMLTDVPRPILLISGEQGSGKSTAARMLVALIDPSPSPFLPPPAKIDEWMISANGSSVVAIDNLSTISDWLSDALCRACTGDGMTKRKLYTDTELAVLTFRRSVLLTGIDLAGLRGDLAERLLSVELVRLEATERRTEANLWRKFNKARPRITGALLSLLSDVLKELPTANPELLPRMADFSRVLMAIDQAWETDAFRTYITSTGSLAIDVLESDVAAKAIAEFLPAVGGSFTGTASDLLSQLPHPNPLPHSWPRNPKALAARLRRLAPALRSVGYTIDSPTDASRTPGTRSRIWRIVAPQTDPTPPIGEASHDETWTGPGHDAGQP